MSDGNVLFVFQSQSDIPDEFDERTFIIEPKLNDLSENRYANIYSSLESMNVTSGTSLPIYKMSRTRLFSGAFSEKCVSIVECIYVAREIKRALSENDINKVHIRSVDDAIEPVILDVLTDRNVETLSNNHYSFKIYWRRMCSKAKTIFVSIIVLLDQLVCFLFSVMKNDKPDDTENIFVPAPDRFRTTKPVLEKMESEYKLVLDQSLLTKIMNNDGTTPGKKYNPIVHHRFSSPKSMLRSVKYILFSFVSSEIILNTTEKKVVNKVEETFGFKLDLTIGHMFGYLYYDGLLNQIQKYFVYTEIFVKTNTENVVVSTGYAPNAESIWFAAQNCGVEAYDLPHMITVNPPQTGVFTDHSFVTGTFAQKYIETHYPKQASSVLTTGRPYLEMLNSSIDTEQGIEEPIKIVIATSPVDDRKRIKLLDQSLQGIKEMSIAGKVKIKPHPSENIEIYKKRQEQTAANFEIVEEDLWGKLENADLVITLNSNVGLEAIICGCVSININHWSGTHLPLPYALEGPVPILRSPSATREFFEDITTDQLKSLSKEQQRFINQGYYLSDTADRIASELETTYTT